MPLNRKRQIGAGHAFTVVGDADQPAAAAIGEDLQPPGARIEGVLHKFLDHACRTLDDLPRGNAVDDGFAELADGHKRRLRWRLEANRSPDRAPRLCWLVEQCGAVPEMERYLPGAILALCGVAVYAIGCVLFVAQRRQRGHDGANKSLFIYAMAL